MQICYNKSDSFMLKPAKGAKHYEEVQENHIGIYGGCAHT